MISDIVVAIGNAVIVTKNRKINDPFEPPLMLTSSSVIPLWEDLLVHHEFERLENRDGCCLHHFLSFSFDFVALIIRLGKRAIS
jgi:hypothetical protein